MASTKVNPAKKTAAKKAPAKKAASSSSTPARKTAAKKAPAKKAPKSVKPSTKKFGGGLKAGDTLMVKVDPRSNNGSDMAPGIVTRVLNVVDGNFVNVKVSVDGDRDHNLRNVAVLGKAPGKKDKDVPTVYALRA